MAEEIIQARLWTKVDTLENWNNNPLLLGPGELALVTNGQGVPMNMKWGDKTTRKRFSELPFAIAYDQGQFYAVTGTVLPASTTGQVRYSLVGEGTYTRAGMTSVVVPAGKMGIIVDDGTTWSLGSTVSLPKGADGQGLLPLFDPAKVGGYMKDAQVRDEDGVTYVSLKAGNTSALSVGVDWEKAGKIVSNNDLTDSRVELLSNTANISDSGVLSSIAGSGTMGAYKFLISDKSTLAIKLRRYINAGFSSLVYAFYSSETVINASTFISGSAKYTGASVEVMNENITPPAGTKCIVILNSGIANLSVIEKTELQTRVEQVNESVVELDSIKADKSEVSVLLGNKADKSDVVVGTNITNKYVQVIATTANISDSGVLSSIAGSGTMGAYKFLISDKSTLAIKLRRYINAGFSSLVYAFYSSETVTNASTFLSGSVKYTGASIEIMNVNLIPPTGAKCLVILNSGISNLSVVEESQMNAVVSSLSEKSNDESKRTGSAIAQNDEYPESKKILYVRKDGSGDFQHIQDAINSITDASITNQYEIRVCDSYLYTDLTNLWLKSNPNIKNTSLNPNVFVCAVVTKNWVNIVGYNKRVKIAVHAPYDLASESFQNVHCLFLQGNVIIDNIDFEIKNGRYAIHQEGNGDLTSIDNNAITVLKNGSAKHLGNSDSANGSAWTSVLSQANGTCSGLELVYENFEWDDFYIHANKDFKTKNKYSFVGCRINSKYGSRDVSSFYIGSNGSGHNFNVNIIGCDFPRVRSNIGIMDNQTLSSPARDIRTMLPSFNGYGNKKMCVDTVNFSQFVLCFKTINNNSSIKVIGGTALKDVFGEYLLNYQGTSDMYGFVAGTEFIGSRGNTYSFTLAHRLGNCASSPKTLIIDVDGVQKTINFSANFVNNGSSYTINTEPAYDNNAIINYINNQISDVAMATSTDSKHSVSTAFKDCSEVAYNYTSITILSGMPLVRDYSNPKGWKVCNVGEIPTAITCERINPGSRGTIAMIEKNMFNNLNGVISGNFPRIAKVGANGTWVTASNINEAILVEFFGSIFSTK